MSLLRMLKNPLGCTHPTPRAMYCLLFDKLVFQSGECGGWEGIRLRTHQSRLSQGGRSEMVWDLGGWSKSMAWPACEHVPCHIAGMLALFCWNRKLCQTF